MKSKSKVAPPQRGRILIQDDVKMYPVCCNGNCLKCNAVKAFMDKEMFLNQVSSKEALRHNTIRESKVLFIGTA